MKIPYPRRQHCLLETTYSESLAPSYLRLTKELDGDSLICGLWTRQQLNRDLLLEHPTSI